MPPQQEKDAFDQHNFRLLGVSGANARYQPAEAVSLSTAVITPQGAAEAKTSFARGQGHWRGKAVRQM